MQNTILFLNEKYMCNKILLNNIKKFYFIIKINNINNLNIFEIKRSIVFHLFA